MAKTGKVDKSRGVIGFGIFDQGSSGQGRLLSAERFCRNVPPHIWKNSEGVDLGPGNTWTACATLMNRERRCAGSGHALGISLLSKRRQARLAQMVCIER